MLSVTSGHIVLITQLDDCDFQEWMVDNIHSSYQVFYMENASLFDQDSVKGDLPVDKIDVAMLFIFESASDATLFKLTWA